MLLPRIPTPTKDTPEADLPRLVSPKRVLVVDDEPPLANQLRTIFELDGHDVHVCTSGEEALAALATQQFDLVLTDLGMPTVTGWDVAGEAKRQLADVRVGLVTGWAEELGDTDDLSTRGVDFVISKPYRLQQVRAATAEALLARAQV
jgi:CheY-like chemotaxis protein